MIARAIEDHAAIVMAGGRVPALTKHLCAAMVGGLTYCTPLVVEHRKHARALGASTAMLNDLWDNARSTHYTDAQKAALTAAVALTREPRGLPATVRATLQAQFSQEEIVEVIAVIGLANYRARMRNALEV